MSCWFMTLPQDGVTASCSLLRAVASLAVLLAICFGGQLVHGPS